MSASETRHGLLGVSVKPQDIERLVGMVMERYRSMVASVDLSLPVADIEEARTHLRGIFGSIKVVSDAREIRFEADLHDTHLALFKGVAGMNKLVAGARWWRCLLRLPRCVSQ